ncbi:hypothetical protein C2G38_2150814 [Gigaspora rosea]|uniref:Uncharacterized protein n=1 Tax=Gigaspora rosea TaxID=44941 RepID=A0A397TQW2_9GLOM|nr:hypothetical protein C2G38_2150814 [Gigaspora rosea]
MHQLTKEALEEHLNSFGDLMALKKKFIADYVDEQQRQAFNIEEKNLNSKNNKPKTKRHKKTKSLLASSQIMQNFSSRNLGTKRVTLRSDSKPGIFNKGKASEKVSTKGVPDLVFSEVDFLNSGSSKKREHDRSDNTYSKSTNRPITRSVRRKIDNVLQSQEDDSTQNQNVVEDNLSQNNDQSSADSSHSSQSHAGDAPSSESPSKLSPEAPPLNSDSNDHSYHGVQSIKSPYFAANVSDDGLQSQDCDNNCNQHQDTQKQIIQDKDDDDKTISSLEDVINSLHSNTGPADDYSCTYRPSGISNDIKDDIKDDSEFNETPEISCTYRPSGIFNDIKDDSEFNEIPEIRNQPNDYYKFSMSDANKKYSSISQAVSSYCASQKPSVTTIGVPSAAVKWLLNEQRTTPNYYASPYTDLHSNENIINEDMAINFREIDLSEIFIWRKHKLH